MYSRNNGILCELTQGEPMDWLQALGPAPRWCSFLDSLAEELEETSNPTGELPNEVIYSRLPTVHNYRCPAI